jgi:hypothetical protein
MSESLYLLGLVMLTSLLAWVFGLRWARLDGAALRPALVRLLEWAGLTVGFYAVNMLAGCVAVVVLRRLTDDFISLYVNTDGTLVLLSALQASIFQWWRAESA